ncbi:hypothetical protein SELMODRAFT_423181 [Selaginella moellendorffii]|uniref:Uncharacterized protein n=1 Tax=Selaginella moellendorffii TaxID=88036 RepID=D8SKU5_SELML|nr:hypothetical protein SELMODRAFT_423181 [Selaginella moellendorffii]
MSPKQKRSQTDRDIPSNAQDLFSNLQKALFLGFWEDVSLQREIAFQKEFEQLRKCIEKLGESNDFVFLIDNYQKLDEPRVADIRGKIESVESLCSKTLCARRDTVMRSLLSGIDCLLYRKIAVFTVGEAQTFLGAHGIAKGSDFLPDREASCARVRVMVTALERMVRGVDSLPAADRIAAVQAFIVCSRKGGGCLLKFLDMRWVLEVRSSWSVETLAKHVFINVVRRWSFSGHPDPQRCCFFSDKPNGFTHIPTLYIPPVGYFYVDAGLRYEANGRLVVRVFQVSLGLQSGDDHWKTTDKFMDSEQCGNFSAQCDPYQIHWIYSWIGRECDRPSWAPMKTTQTAAGITCQEEFFSFEDIAKEIPSKLSTGVYIVQGLQSVSGSEYKFNSASCLGLQLWLWLGLGLGRMRNWKHHYPEPERN